MSQLRNCVSLLFVLDALGAICFGQAKPKLLPTPQPITEQVEHGRYWKYIPRTVSAKSQVLVACHGMFKENDTADNAARVTLDKWIALANETGTVVIAPIFDNERYGCTVPCPQNWGYRGLFGRQVGADEFVHEILDRLKEANPQYDGRMVLFGFSAGGQFVARYVVMHPERVIAAVAGASAWFPFPNPDVQWPNGMKRRQRVIRWPGEKEDQVIDVKPNPENWVAAAELPLLVISGAQDLEVQKHDENQGGDTHPERSQAWTKAMNDYAAAQGHTGRVKVSIVPNVDHSITNISKASAQFLKDEIQKQQRRPANTKPATTKKAA